MKPAVKTLMILMTVIPAMSLSSCDSGKTTKSPEQAAYTEKASSDKEKVLAWFKNESVGNSHWKLTED